MMMRRITGSMRWSACRMMKWHQGPGPRASPLLAIWGTKQRWFLERPVQRAAQKWARSTVGYVANRPYKDVAASDLHLPMDVFLMPHASCLLPAGGAFQAEEESWRITGVSNIHSTQCGNIIMVIHSPQAPRRRNKWHIFLLLNVSFSIRPRDKIGCVLL